MSCKDKTGGKKLSNIFPLNFTFPFLIMVIIYPRHSIEHFNYKVYPIWLEFIVINVYKKQLIKISLVLKETRLIT